MAKVSIVIPVYNVEKYVSEALDSALMQTHYETEIICIDDASTDDSLEILNSYAERFERVTVLKNKNNMGLARTRNLGIEHAGGEFILPLDADDLIDPNYCTKALEVFAENPATSVVYSRATMFDSAKLWPWELPCFSAERMMEVNHVFCSAFFRKVDWVSYGGYRENMKYGYEDWDFWLHFVLDGKIFYRIPENFFYYRQSEGSMIQQIMSVGREEEMIAQIQLNHPELKIKKFLSKLQKNLWKVNAGDDLDLELARRVQMLGKFVSSSLGIEMKPVEASTLIQEKDSEQLRFVDFFNEFGDSLDELKSVQGELKSVQDELKSVLFEKKGKEDELQGLKDELIERELTIESARSWQDGSWFNRAFHKWRP